MHGLEGSSLTPQLRDPTLKRGSPVVSTWQYKNHAVRSADFRYIRYRDGSEELYDHRVDPGEHHNLAQDPGFQSVKKRLSKAIPKRNVKPAPLQSGEQDSYGKKFETLREFGVPAWLGTIPTPPHLP